MRAIRVMIGALAVAAMLMPSARADEFNKQTFLTFSGPVALPGVTLDAGTYAFELVDPASSSNVVVVRDRNRTRPFYMGLTMVVPRPAGMDNHGTVSLGEAPRGEPKPIVAWYPSDASYGLQFIYAR